MALQPTLPAASFLLLRLTAAIAILAGCHLSALHLHSSCDLRSQERKGRALETVSANPTWALARLVLRHAGLWLPRAGAPGPLQGKGEVMSGLLPSLQGCSTLPPPSSSFFSSSRVSGSVRRALLGKRHNGAHSALASVRRANTGAGAWQQLDEGGGDAFPSFFAAS